MYDGIRESLSKGGRCLVIVPDQFTVEAEREAMDYLGVDILMDLEITSLSKMADRIKNEVGGFLDRIEIIGRKMLLTKLMLKNKDKLEHFKGYEDEPDFIDSLLNLIGDIKESCVSPEEMQEIVKDLEDKKESKFLISRLSELTFLYEAYEDSLENKQLDSNDMRTVLAEKIPESTWLAKQEFWLYGFDSFSKRDMQIVKALEKAGKSLNIIVTYSGEEKFESLFAPSKRMIDLIEATCESVDKIQIEDPEYLRFPPAGERSEAEEDLARIEESAFSLPIGSYKPLKGQAVKLIHGSDIYDELHKVARTIMDLIAYDDEDEDSCKGLRLRDISIISGEAEEIAPIIKRVFESYGLAVFIDDKRSLMHTAGALYLKRLLEYVSEGFKVEDALKMAKTGMTDVSEDMTEALQVYCRAYGISPAQFKQAFYRGREDFDDRDFAALEEARQALVGPIIREKTGLNARLKAAQTGAEMAGVLRNFLKEIGLEDKLDQLQEEMEAAKYIEEASELSQMWDIITELLDQMDHIMQDEKLSKPVFAKMLIMGLNSKQIGVIPSTVDGLVIGSLRRSRRAVPAVTFIIGANDGKLPKLDVSEGLLGLDDIEKLKKHKHDILGSPMDSVEEQNLALYRAASVNKQGLYISYRDIDIDGKELEKSSFYNTVLKLHFPPGQKGDPLEEDVLFEPFDSQHAGIDRRITGANVATENVLVRRMAEEKANASKLAEDWKRVRDWYDKSDICRLEDLTKGVFYSNEMHPLTPDQVDSFYKNREGQYKISVSRVQQFSECPFKFFVRYGLKAAETKKFEMRALEFGSLMHECLDSVLGRLAERHDDQPLASTRLAYIDRAGVDEEVEKYFQLVGESFCRGLFTSDAEKAYLLRRIQDAAKDLSWFVVKELQEEVNSEEFSGDRKLKNVSTELKMSYSRCLDKNIKICLTGIIDRLDEFDDGSYRIIDYKSGEKKVSINQIKNGDLIQLEVYLLVQAKKSNSNPAESEAYFMKMVGGVGAGKEDSSRYFARKGGYAKGEFDSFLQEETKQTLDEKIRSIISGCIDVAPLRGDLPRNSACQYCEYKGICTYDTDIKGSLKR